MAKHQYPHQKILVDNGIEKDAPFLSSSTKRAITLFDKLLNNYEKMTDTTQKNQAEKQLKENSEKIAELLNADLEEKASQDKIDQEKAEKAKDKKPAAKDDDDDKDDDAKKAKADKAAADKAKADKEKSDKEKSDKDKADKDKVASDKKNNPYNLSESALLAKASLDKIWAEKAKNGSMEISESDLSAADINPWTYLGMTTGKIGPYNFKAPLSSDNWTVTKDKSPDPATT